VDRMDLVDKYQDLKQRILDCNNKIFTIKVKKENEENIRKNILKENGVSSIDELRQKYDLLSEQLNNKLDELAKELDQKEAMIKEIQTYAS
jgi:vacuolar-type H+-ATPase subunit I/STV1